MYFSRSVIVSALMGFAAAESQSIAASESISSASATSLSLGSLSTGTPAGMVATHIIQVGGPNGSLAFYPNSVKAAPGDLVQFQFHPKNHSVVQSTFDNPCIPIQNIQANKTDAFYSGFMPTNASFAATSQVLTYTIRVKDEKPVWFYCSQGKHCQAGMVGAINAPAAGNRTMEAFVALAASATENLSPGQAPGSGGSAGGNTPPSPSSGSGTAGGNDASGTGSGPAQATANVAAGLSSQSFFGLGAAAVAAIAML
ncbi:Cupredoxin [Pyrenochaeta sp. MPI-SDFR-AT-0127]|nr:Cupredoxin [Pyrenochaeta sp. MPI-SDFR-AT-0127]